MEIRNFDGLISSLLTELSTFMWYDAKRLLAPGENYGSVMAQVDVVLINKERKKYTVHCVAKLVPPSPFIWKLFNIPVTFKKEIAFYDIIAEELKHGSKHHRNNLLSCIPKYIGSRISLDAKSNEVDEDAVLLLRNLKEDGYVCGDRFTGFDRETAMMLLSGLAALHACTIAYKLKRQKEFQEIFMPHLQQNLNDAINEETMQTIITQLIESLEKTPECVSLIGRVEKTLKEYTKELAKEHQPSEPFATLVHNDLGTNNMMVKFEDGRPTSIKFVDFQIVGYANPAIDVLFFLYSSVRLEELVNVDDYIKAYHDRFISVLETLDCDASKFSFDAFKQEVDSASKLEFCHILFMLLPIFTKKGEAKELNTVQDDSDLLLGTSVLHDNFYPRLSFIVEDFARRGWI